MGKVTQAMAIAPELILCIGILAVFCASLGESMFSKARKAALATAILALLATVMTLSENSTHFFSIYQVNKYIGDVKVLTITEKGVVLLKDGSKIELTR